MTVKEIAIATSKPERTVHNWVKKTSANMAQVYAKMAQGLESKKPADYDLEETCAIIETGLGKNAANLYRMNAQGVPAQQSSLTEKDLELITVDLIPQMQ